MIEGDRITSGADPALFAGFTLDGRLAPAIMFPSLAAEPHDVVLYGMALR